MLDGHESVGTSLSLIVTVKLHDAVLPEASVTTNMFVVVPFGNVDPLASPVVCAVVAPGQVSAPIGALYVTIAPHVPGSAFCVMLDGQESVGTSLSLIVTVKLQDAVLPDTSVTTKVFVVVP